MIGAMLRKSNFMNLKTPCNMINTKIGPDKS